MDVNRGTNPVKILMLDSSGDDFNLIKAGFESDGCFSHTIEQISTVEAALDKIRKSVFDLALVCYDLGPSQRLSGLDFVIEMRKKNILIPAIILTNSENEKICQKTCKKLHVSRCLAKQDHAPSGLISIILDTILHFK